MSPSAFTTNGVPPNGGADERQGWLLSERFYGTAMIYDLENLCAGARGKIEGRLELLIQAALSFSPRQTKKAGTGSGFLFFLRLRRLTYKIVNRKLSIVN